MALQPRLEDVLHLVMWNGFAADCGAAIATCKETWTDERLWFPFGINLRYGPNQKTRLQIISDHCIPLDNGKKTVIRDDRKKGDPKPKNVVYKTHEYFLKRAEELRAHAEATHHQKAFQKALDAPDANGNTILISATYNGSIPVVDYLIENVVDMNHQSNYGLSALNYARAHSDNGLWKKLLNAGALYDKEYRFTKGVKKVDYLPREKSDESDESDERINRFIYTRTNGRNIFPAMEFTPWAIKYDIKFELKFNDSSEKKVKKNKNRMKASLYKQQFGRK